MTEAQAPLAQGAPSPQGPSPVQGVSVVPPFRYFPQPPPAGDGKMMMGILVTVAAALIALTVILPVIVFFMISGLTTSPPMAAPEPVGLAAGGWSNGSVNVAVTTAPTHGIGAAELTFLIMELKVTLYFNGLSGVTQAVNGTWVAVTYGDADADRWMSRGDRIHVVLQPATDARLLVHSVLRVLDGTGAFRGVAEL